MSQDPKPLLTAEDIKAREETNIGPGGLKIERVFTKGLKDPFETVNFDKRVSRIVNPDGSIVFEMKEVEVPDFWSQVATDILAQKYFRKRDVPQTDAEGNPILNEEGEQVLGAETSAKQTISRLASTWRWWGESYGYFNRKLDAQVFEDELKYMLMHQIFAPNSPQWFNTGLRHAYSIKGHAQGHWYADPETGEPKLSEDAYSRPQIHACFIQSVQDDLVGEGGILDLVLREARLFKYGSGTGTNFSPLRGSKEKLSGGGYSSGMMSFLNIFDAAAGSIKSGGTTRRAAKMVCVDIDHPEIEQFIEWKVIEEQKVADLVAGSYANYGHLKAIMKSAETSGIDPEKNHELKKLIRKAKESFVPLSYVKRVLMLLQNGMTTEEFDFRRYDTDFRSEAYSTVGGQNANNSVRVTNEFLDAVREDKEWNLINRTDGKVNKTVKARDLWKKITYSAWASADPGLQYHSIINDWHTCKTDGEIIASNPCSEYMFLDDTACNLASFTLTKFYDETTGVFDIEKYRHAIRLVTIVLEISVLMSQLPSRVLAEKTYKYRTLGLGYADLGTLLMMQGIPYDSEEGYAVTGALSAILTGESYATSAEMAKVVGTFDRYSANKKHMLRVMRNHRRAAFNAAPDAYEELSVTPMGINPKYAPDDMLEAARKAWDYALMLGEKFGYRNAQATCIAPTGTIGLVMDAQTTGIEPDFALVKFKKLVGGGYFKLVNQSVEPALRRLGYSEDQIKEIVTFAVGAQTLVGAPHINTETLTAKGFGPKELAAVEAVLPSMFELKYAFTKWTLGEDFCRNVLKLDDSQMSDSSLNILKELGFTDEQITEAEDFVAGRMSMEGAPGLKPEHYSVFDCANKCGKYGKRYIHYRGHLKQMAAAQPFISGAISKTINLPEEATLQDVDDAYMESWDLMLKATALYRDGSKLSQPLSTGSADDALAKLFMFSEEDVIDEQVTPQQLHVETVKHAERLIRHKLPDERHSITHKFDIAGHKGYLTVGLYEDGKPGEIFISMQKEGSTLRGIMDALAVSLSWNLQYGVPLEELVRKFTHVRFEPAGMTNNREIPIAKSMVDYIARYLAVKFLDADTAKKYHNTDLVDYSYTKGSNSRIYIPVINGRGFTEVRRNYASSDEAFAAATRVVEEVVEEVVIEKAPQPLKVMAQTSNVSSNLHVEMASHEPTPVKMDLGEQEAAMTKLAKQQQNMAMKKNNEDAEICRTCGSSMVRQGSCYYCTSCGETSGCS